jgi:hypothetical protein
LTNRLLREELGLYSACIGQEFYVSPHVIATTAFGQGYHHLKNEAIEMERG